MGMRPISSLPLRLQEIHFRAYPIKNIQAIVMDRKCNIWEAMSSKVGDHLNNTLLLKDLLARGVLSSQRREKYSVSVSIGLTRKKKVNASSIYLRTEHKLIQLEIGKWVWGISPSSYIREAVQNYNDCMSKDSQLNYRLPKWDPNQFPTKCELGINYSIKLSLHLESNVQSLIEIK